MIATSLQHPRGAPLAQGTHVTPSSLDRATIGGTWSPKECISGESAEIPSLHHENNISRGLWRYSLCPQYGDFIEHWDVFCQIAPNHVLLKIHQIYCFIKNCFHNKFITFITSGHTFWSHLVTFSGHIWSHKHFLVTSGHTFWSHFYFLVTQ